MQATVRTYDTETHGGSVLLDDGTELTFGAEAFDAGGLRFVRPGQRVNLRLDDDGAIDYLTLATFPVPER